MSRPGLFSLETGIGPSMLLSVRSSQSSWDIVPIEGGMTPLKLLEFKDLHSYVRKLIVTKVEVA